MELLITTVLLAVGFLGLSAMIVGTVRGVSISQIITTATTLAQDRTEQIRQADYDAVVAANYPPEDYNTIAGHQRFRRTVAIQNNAPQANMKTITVTVSWRQETGQVRNFDLVSTISR